MVFAAGLVGGLAFGLYLTMTSLWLRGHTDEASAALRIPDFKNFVRLHVRKEGHLIAYTIGVPRACRHWRFQPHVRHQPWFAPDGDTVAPVLIEPPIELT